MNITLEIRLFGKHDSLVINRILTPSHNLTPLMKRDRTEITEPEAASVMRYRELYLLYRGNAAVLFVDGMIRPHVRQFVGIVKFRLRNRALRRVLYQHHIAVPLNYRPPIDLVLLVVLLAACLGIRLFVIANYLVAVALHRAERSILGLGKVTDTAQVVHIGKPLSLLEPIEHFR